MMAPKDDWPTRDQWPTHISIPPDWPELADYVLEYGQDGNHRVQRVNLRDFVAERVAAGRHLDLYDLIVEVTPGERTRPFRMSLSWLTGF